MESEPLAGLPARFRKVPYRAVRDTSLPAGALRLLIAIACNADREGRCELEAGRLAAEVGLTPDEIARFSEQLADAAYLSAAEEGSCCRYQLVAEPGGHAHANGETVEEDLRPDRPPGTANGRPRGISRMMRAWRVADRFSFWLRTVLPPDDTDVFWGWALRNEDDYHDLVRRFGEARDDSALEALLSDTVAVIADLGRAPSPADPPDQPSAA